MPEQTAEPEQAIRERAYRLWEEAGRPEGRDAEFWARAVQLAATPDRVTIFAYGSSMNESVMTERCPGAQAVGQGQLPDHQICFPRWSDSRQSFVAGFKPAVGEVLRGVLWQVALAELPRLDAAEGYQPGRNSDNSYLRRDIEVIDQHGVSRTVQTYIAESGTTGVPSAKYLGLIIAGAESHGLPRDYIAALQGFRGPERSASRRWSRVKTFIGRFSPEHAYQLGRAMMDVQARKAKRRAFRNAYRHRHREVSRWRAAAFIPDCVEDAYLRTFYRTLYPIERENLKTKRIRLIAVIGLFGALLLYCLMLPMLMPASVTTWMPDRVAAPSATSAFPHWVNATMAYAGAVCIAFMSFALWFDLFLLVGLLLILLGFSEMVSMVIAESIGVTIAATISLGGYIAAFPSSFPGSDFVRFAAAAFLGCTAIFGATLLLLAGIVESLRRKSERLWPDANCVRLIFDALWTLQCAGAGWTSLATRSSAMQRIGRASDIARRTLLPRPSDEGSATLVWREQQARKICAALASKQTWLITPKPDTRDALFAALGPLIIALLSGAWDNLELASESILAGDEPVITGRLWHMTADLLRTLLIAAFPALLFLLANLAGILVDVGAPALGYVKIGLFVWAALSVLFRLDPLLKEKLAALKEATQMLKPGGKKE